MKRTPLKRRTPLQSRSRPQARAKAQLRRVQQSVMRRRGPSQPNAVQTRWRELVRDLGSVISGPGATIEIHHCAGRTARHNGVHIGHWWILPLTHDEHQGPDGIHAHPRRKYREQCLFETVMHRIVMRQMGVPECFPPLEVREAIRSYHR